MKFKKLFAILLLLMMHIAQADVGLEQKAHESYSNQQWQESAKLYKKMIKNNPESEQARYRLAQSYLQLKQGKKALKANEKLKDAQQIPLSLVHYQKSQALSLMGKEKAMWEALESAVQAGFTNLNDLQNNTIWQAHRDKKDFKTIMMNVDKSLRPCVYDAVYQQFDFWLGEWDVYGNVEKTGPIFGRNSIVKKEQGCLIMEHWQGASGSTGTSMNYFDGLQQKWVQRWVSGGVSIDYSGGLIDVDGGKKAMQLIGKIYYASSQQQPQVRDFRGTWTPLNDGVVQQFFEESIDGGKTWNSWFNGFYFPTEEETKDE